MVLPVSGFLPVPLPMMIPFMGAQSLVIGKMFGEGFQYGKRKISAMPNESFNKLTFEDMMSNARAELKASIPTINASLQDMQPMVEVVVREFFNYISLVTKTVTGTGGGDNIFQQEGHDIGDWITKQLGIPHQPHGGQTTIPVTPVSPVIPEVDKFIPPKKPTIDVCASRHKRWTALMLRARSIQIQIKQTTTNVGKPARFKQQQLQSLRRTQKQVNEELNAALNNPNNRECVLSWRK